MSLYFPELKAKAHRQGGGEGRVAIQQRRRCCSSCLAMFPVCCCMFCSCCCCCCRAALVSLLIRRVAAFFALSSTTPTPATAQQQQHLLVTPAGVSEARVQHCCLLYPVIIERLQWDMIFCAYSQQQSLDFFYCYTAAAGRSCAVCCCCTCAARARVVAELSSFSCLLALNFVCASAAVAALMILLTLLAVYRASCNLSNNVSHGFSATPEAAASLPLPLSPLCRSSTLIKWLSTFVWILHAFCIRQINMKISRRLAN